MTRFALRTVSLLLINTENIFGICVSARLVRVANVSLTNSPVESEKALKAIASFFFGALVRCVKQEAVV